MDPHAAIVQLHSMDRTTFLEDCRQKGIKGKPNDPCLCLVANWLKRKCPNEHFIAVEETDVLFFSCHFAIMPWVKQFIQDFDNGTLDKEFYENPA